MINFGMKLRVNSHHNKDSSRHHTSHHVT